MVFWTEPPKALRDRKKPISEFLAGHPARPELRQCAWFRRPTMVFPIGNNEKPSSDAKGITIAHMAVSMLGGSHTNTNVPH